MSYPLFENREEAGWRLAERLERLRLEDPLVLAVPRGGIEVAVPLARSLGAELDVILSRKLRAPDQPELALGAVSESGEMYLNHHGGAVTEAGRTYLEMERRRQMTEIERRVRMFRAVRPQVPVKGRSVILTDDGIATGSTMMAALRTVRASGARQVILAVPVAAADSLGGFRALCDQVICLHEPDVFWAVGQFYRNFDQVTDERVVELLGEYAHPAPEHRGEVHARHGAKTPAA